MDTTEPVPSSSNATTDQSQTPQLPSPVEPPTTPENEPVTYSDSRKPSRAKLFTLIGLAAVVVLGTVGYVLGFYLPNSPKRVWESALTNTGKGLEGLIQYADSDALTKKLATQELNGTFKYQSPGFSTDGSLQAISDDKNSTFSGDFGLGVTRVKVQGVMQIPDNSVTPDTYLKVSGIKGLEGLMGIPGIDSLDNQWIVIDHSLLDNIAAQQAQVDEDAGTIGATPTSADISEVAKVFAETSNKYIFTTDRSTAVLSMQNYVGEEVVDGKNTKHYKVSADKEHLKAYIKELGTNLDKTKLNSWTKENYKKSLSELFDLENATEAADNINPNDTFDVWVNTKTKIIHKARFSDTKNPDKKYFELGFNYDGGAEKPFFINIRDGSDDKDFTANINLSIDTEKNIIKLGAQMKENAEASKNSGSFELSVKPGPEKVEVTIPKDTITVAEMLNQLGLGAFLGMLEQSPPPDEPHGSIPPGVLPLTLQ